MLKRKITSVLVLTLVVGTLSAATAFAAEANKFSFQPTAPVSHMTQRLDENTTISGNDMFDRNAAEVDGCAVIALTGIKCQTFALTGDESVGSEAASFTPTAKEVAMTTIPFNETTITEHSGRLTLD